MSLPRSLRPPAMLSVLIAAAGCVEPRADRPWSTKDRSMAAAAEPAAVGEPTTTPRAVTTPTRTEPAAPEPTPNAETPRAETPSTVPTIRTGGTPEERARAWLALASDDEYALVRAYAFEAMQHAPDLLAELGPRGLVDPNRGVRFVTTMAMGRAELRSAAALIEPGLLDESDSVRAASIFALRSFGEAADPSPLAGMAMSEDPEIRGNATMILGMLGNPSAIPVIEASLGRGMRLQNPMRVRITELQAAEALVSLGDQEDVEPIRAALFAPVEQGELTVLACDILGRLEDQQARPMLMRLILAEGTQRRPPEIRVAAAGAIFRLPGPHEPFLQGILLEAAGGEDPRLRTQAAEALSRVETPEARSALERLLSDEELPVRTAAAGSLLTHARSAGFGTENSPPGLAATPPD